MKRRHVLRLYEEFKEQHAAGVCKCTSFPQLLRLNFPGEGKERHALMLQAAHAHEAERAEAEAQAEADSRDAEALFAALDTDGQGTIDLGEFLQLRKISALEMNRAQLKALFYAKDADGSGELDLQEFKELCKDSKLLEHQAAILSQGNASKARHEENKRAKAELWRLGLPKEKPKPRPLSERPSLVGVSDAIANMRKAMGSV